MFINHQKCSSRAWESAATGRRLGWRAGQSTSPFFVEGHSTLESCDRAQHSKELPLSYGFKFHHIASACLLVCALSVYCAAQIRVNPTGLNTSTQSPTVAFLTFGNLNNQVPAEATWCGELIPATPAIGLKCNPATIFGLIPLRYDRTTTSGTNAYTDIMTLPASVARRAYQAAAGGTNSSFFFVRRFVSTIGGPDEFVVVTCRMAGGEASSPFSLTNVELGFSGSDKPILFVKVGDKLPQLKAEITYTGTGRLKGRWEIVTPGEELPQARDLLTEATLPIEDRATQRRYTQLSRFNVFVPPNGKYTLWGPDPASLPMNTAGEYLLLLRIEASDADVGSSNLAAVGAGPGIVNSGAVAGFPLPVLRYFVGAAPGPLTRVPRQLAPADNKIFTSTETIDFAWIDAPDATVHRLEIADANGKVILSALLPAGAGFYRAPPWVRVRADNNGLRWRLIALNEVGHEVGASSWLAIHFADVNALENPKP